MAERLGRAVLAFLFALFFGPVRLPSQSPVSNPSSAVAPGQTGSDPYSTEPYVFELIQKRIRFDADGRGQRDSIIRVRVQSESAVREFGLLAYSFAASFESLDVVYARVRKPNGTIVETPASDVQELDSAVSREAPMYTDEREKHIAVKSLSVGDVLEFQLRWTVHDPIASGHFWYEDSYFREGICLKQIFEFRLPKAIPVKFHYSDPRPEIREEADTRIYTFQTAHLKREPESKIPAWEKDFHGVDPPDLRLSSFASWEDVGRWFGSLQQARLTLTPEIRAKSEELTRGKNSEDEKIRALYDFVSLRVRYIGVDLGMGRYSPHAASDVLANRYGDCKDKHTLLAALLNAAGISAFPVLISSKFRLDQAFPSVSLFDHLITAIPRGNSLVFLDTTPEIAPFGLLVSTLRGRPALVIPTNAQPYLANIPADSPVPNREIFHSEATVDDKGNLDAKVELQDWGDSEVVLRAVYRATSQNRWEQLTETLVAGMGFGGKVTNSSVDPPEDTSKPFSIRYDYHRELPDWKDRRMLLPLPPFFLPELNDEQKQSKDPLPLGSPQEVTYEAIVTLPKSYSFQPPPNEHRKTDFAEFTATYSMDKLNTLHGTVHLRIFAPEVPGDKRSAYSDLVKVAQDTYSRYIFVKGDFAAGTTSPLPSVMGGVIPPGTILPGPNPNNIPALEKALAAYPESEAFVYLLGRAYTKNGRPKDAVALLEKSLPQFNDSTGQLSFALGEAYLALPEPDKALQQFQKALGDDPPPTMLNEVAWALVLAGAHLQDALDYSTRSVTGITSQTADFSAEDAGPSDFRLMPQLAASWDTLGWIHFRLGDFAKAKKYLLSAWQLQQSAALGEHLVEVYERLGQSQKAAEVCVMALAAIPDPGYQQKLSHQMERLKPFLKPGFANGPMALSDFRTLHVPFRAKFHEKSLSAHFAISISNGSKADSIVFSSGAVELRGAIPDLRTIRYPQSFPDDTPTHVLRKATLSCSFYTKDCTLILLPIADAAVPGS